MAKLIQLKDKEGYVYPINEVYSTKEQVIGTWIDGKPLYRKTLTISIAYAIPANTWTTIISNYSFSNLKYLTRSTIINVDNNNPGELNYFTVQYFKSDSTFKALQSRNISVNIASGSFLVIEYTKTID